MPTHYGQGQTSLLFPSEICPNQVTVFPPPPTPNQWARVLNCLFNLIASIHVDPEDFSSICVQNADNTVHFHISKSRINTNIQKLFNAIQGN